MCPSLHHMDNLSLKKKNRLLHHTLDKLERTTKLLELLQDSITIGTHGTKVNGKLHGLGVKKCEPIGQNRLEVMFGNFVNGRRQGICGEITSLHTYLGGFANGVMAGKGVFESTIGTGMFCKGYVLASLVSNIFTNSYCLK